MNENLENAVFEYLYRRFRLKNPAGKFDRGGRWYPADEEKQACCENVREPSRHYPYSLLNHCRTSKHIANIYQVSETDILREARKYVRDHSEASIKEMLRFMLIRDHHAQAQEEEMKCDG